MTFKAGFTTDNLAVLRSKINAALAEIDPNLTFTIGTMTYSEGEVGMKLTANVAGMKSKADIQFERYCELYGFDHTISKRFPKLGECKLVAYNSRRRTMPWVIEAQNKKRYKLSQEEAEKHWSEVKSN